MKRISDWLNKVSSGWVTLAAVIIFILFSALVLPGQSARSEEEGGSERSPDLSLYYSAGELYQMAEEYARLLGFPRSHGDVIVMDDVDREIRDVIFKDPVMVGAETAYPRPNPALLPIGEPRPLGDGLRYDDPQGSGEGPVAPVPEPGTAALLATGLAILAFRHRYQR